MIPKINDKPKYEIVIPSTGQKVRYRPYLVKEERVLLAAFESKDERAGLMAIADTVEACIDEDINAKSLTLFDIEYLYTMIRTKSVGETAPIKINCSTCNHQNDFAVKLDDVNVSEENRGHAKIKIDDEISVEMKHPSYIAVINNKDILSSQSENEKKIQMVAESIYAILTEEEKVLVKDEPREDLFEFIESLSQLQFEELYTYVRSAPKLEYKVNFNCVSCGENNDYTVRETNDFF